MMMMKMMMMMVMMMIMSVYLCVSKSLYECECVVYMCVLKY